MSWMSQLFKTYDNNIEREQQDGISLTPIAHMNANAQIEITLNQNGEFQSAAKLDKTKAVTLIPVNEASASRAGSKTAPHPLSDTLSYIAGDFSSYCENEKQKKSAEEKYEAYCKNLEKWRNSEFSHPKVQAVYQYLTQKTVISDLIKAGWIGIEEGTFDSKKINGQPYEKVMVRFRVHGGGPGDDRTWKDSSLIRAYIKYYSQEQQGQKDICYFTGREAVTSATHPKGILAANYGAKLISANDSQGYTYRGRFLEPGQAYALSYEASQKIHGALTWLAKKQGVSIGGQDKRTFICWNPGGKKTPDIFGDFGLGSDDDIQDTEILYRKKLWKTFQGYQNQFDETDSVIVIALDAATTGRLSVTYYHELAASDFLNRIIEWGNTCSWLFLKLNSQKKPYHTIETPTFSRIVECAYGRQKGNFLEADDKVLKEQTQRLVKCMLEKQQIPLDLIRALTHRASTPMAYSGWNRERILSTACALIRKYHDNKGKGRQEDMKLNTDNQDRSYLFGRLLAVYESAERLTYDKGEQREPNAVRLQAAYVNHPMQTLQTLQELMNPYFQKLYPGLREKYRDLIGEIIASFREEDEPLLNQGLQETYLLGYYLQRAELRKKKEDKENGSSAKQN